MCLTKRDASATRITPPPEAFDPFPFCSSLFLFFSLKMIIIFLIDFSSFSPLYQSCVYLHQLGTAISVSHRQQYHTFYSFRWYTGEC